MHFFVPCHVRLERYLLGDPDISFYNSIDGFPELCGGRWKHTTNGLLIPRDQIERVANTFSKSFYLTANSTNAKLTPENKWIFKLLEHYNCGVVVAKKDFAEDLKQEFPNLRVHASCVMSFYTEFQEILESDLFEMVCPPQFNNYCIPKMVDLIPRDQRHRCYYIVNSECQWNSHCRFHYEDMSLSYEGKRSQDYLARSESGELHHELPLANESEELEALRTLFRVDALENHGFTTFKIQGRDRRPLLNLYILEVARRKATYPRVRETLEWKGKDPQLLADLLSELE